MVGSNAEQANVELAHNFCVLERNLNNVAALNNVSYVRQKPCMNRVFAQSLF